MQEAYEMLTDKQKNLFDAFQRDDLNRAVTDADEELQMLTPYGKGGG